MSTSSPSSTCTPQVTTLGPSSMDSPQQALLRCQSIRDGEADLGLQTAGLSWTHRPSPLLGKPLHWEQEADLPTGSTNPPEEKTKRIAGHAALSGKRPASSPEAICPHSSPLPPCWTSRKQPSATQPVTSGPILGKSLKVLTLNEI